MTMAHSASSKQRRVKGSGHLKRRGRSRIWTAVYTDSDGKRRERSTGTSVRRDAERILANWTEQENQVRSGLIDPETIRQAHGSWVPVADAITEYINNSTRKGDSPRHIQQKQRHLELWIESSGAITLADLTTESAENFLDSRLSTGIGSRTWNAIRQALSSFMNWCCDRFALRENPILKVPTKDERMDVRHVRRALTDDELGRLLAVGRRRGREAWYAVAAFSGMRLGEMKQLDWSDVDFHHAVITLRKTKAKRIQHVPITDELKPILLLHHAHQGSPASGKVWKTTVTDRTRQKDFARAAIAHRDAGGKVADLHCLRTTLGTRLARMGVAPQVAQTIMRHSDIRVTMEHYTDLTLADSREALNCLPAVLTDRALDGVNGNPVNRPTNCPPNVHPSPELRASRRGKITPRRQGRPFPSARGHSSVGRASASQAVSPSRNPSELGQELVPDKTAPSSAPLSGNQTLLTTAWDALPPEAKAAMVAFLAHLMAEFGARILPAQDREGQ